MRIAVQIEPQHSRWSDIADAVHRAEEMGVDIVYNWDHFFPLSGDPEGFHFECWTMLGAWAELTERVEIGALVSCNSYRNPQLLADMARTVDHISGGRLILGIGAGWFKKDYREYGYEFGTVGSRLRDLDAAMPVIAHRLARLNPPPLRKLPILIGGSGEKVTLRITAQHADIWHGFGSPERFRHKNDVLDRWCRRVGRDPADIERAIGVRDPSDTSQANAYLRAGAGQVTLSYEGPDFTFDGLADWLNWRDRVG